PAEVQARHILIVPEVTEADRSRALALADTLVELIRGGAPLDSLTRLYHDESEQAIVEGASRAELPDAYSSALSLATAGDVIGPVLVEVAPGLVKYAVVRVNEVRSEGPPTFADVREQIRRALAQEDSVRRYVQRLRSVTYIDIRT
ncbi:MAG: peptidylprolyl isomerase, partial [Gemmatimonadales bacterium]